MLPVDYVFANEPFPSLALRGELSRTAGSRFRPRLHKDKTAQRNDPSEGVAEVVWGMCCGGTARITTRQPCHCSNAKRPRLAGTTQKARPMMAAGQSEGPICRHQQTTDAGRPRFTWHVPISVSWRLVLNLRATCRFNAFTPRHFPRPKESTGASKKLTVF